MCPYVYVKRLNEYATMPTRAHDTDAGLDMYATQAAYIDPHQTEMIHTGICMAIPNGYFGGIYARSGLATKQGLRPANCVGVVDSEYRGEVMVALHNDSDEMQVVNIGDKIAQMIVQECPNVKLLETDNLDDTTRGNDGFGSTGR